MEIGESVDAGGVASIADVSDVDWFIADGVFWGVLVGRGPVGESAKEELEVEGSDVLTIQKGLYYSMILVLQRLYPFFGYRGHLLLPSIQRELEKISNSMPLDRSDAELDCIATIEDLLKRLKRVYLRDAIRDRQEDSLNMLCFVAIALTPEWHQLVLDDSALHWERVIRSQIQKMPALVFQLLEQPVFQNFIGDNTARLLSFVKLPHQPFPKGPEIALKIYDYCVKHYAADIQKEVFDHYDALYPKVFKERKGATSSNNDLELAQSMTVLSFNR